MRDKPDSSKVSFSSLSPDVLPGLDWDRVSFAGAFVFSTDGKLLCLEQPHRGIDIPGGHRDPGESPLETLGRETLEEIGVTVKHAQAVLLRECSSPYNGIEKPVMAYSVVNGVDPVKAAEDFANRPETHRDEVSEIRFLDPDEFIARYEAERPHAPAFVESMKIGLTAAREHALGFKGVRVAMVGLGDHNIRGHLVPLNADPRVSEVSVFDPKGMAAYANLLGKYSSVYEGVANKISSVIPDFMDVVADPEVKIVFISSPDQFHAEQTADCLERGKHVFCEKPLIHSIAEVPALVENVLLAKSKGLVLSSCHPRRFDPPFVWLKSYLESEEAKTVLGNVDSVGFDFAYPVPEEGKEGLHSGLLADHFNHEIDLVNFMFGFSHYKARRISDSQTAYEVMGTRKDGILFHFRGKRKSPKGSKYAEVMWASGNGCVVSVNAESGEAILETPKEIKVIATGLFTGYVERFELTTKNMVDAVLAGGRNYLTPRDLFLNSVSGAVLAEEGKFDSENYQDVLTRFE